MTIAADKASVPELHPYRKMEEIRERVDQIVKDPATAEALKPYYNQLCKRPCFHDEYLETFNRGRKRIHPSAGLRHSGGRR